MVKFSVWDTWFISSISSPLPMLCQRCFQIKVPHPSSTNLIHTHAHAHTRACAAHLPPREYLTGAHSPSFPYKCGTVHIANQSTSTCCWIFLSSLPLKITSNTPLSVNCNQSPIHPNIPTVFAEKYSQEEIRDIS